MWFRLSQKVEYSLVVMKYGGFGCFEWYIVCVFWLKFGVLGVELEVWEGEWRGGLGRFNGLI